MTCISRSSIDDNFGMLYKLLYKRNVRYQKDYSFTRLTYQETCFHACTISSKYYNRLVIYRICETMIFLNVIRNFCITLLLHIRPISILLLNW